MGLLKSSEATAFIHCPQPGGRTKAQLLQGRLVVRKGPSNGLLVGLIEVNAL